ncbi:MAG: hypothetical protein DMF56_11690 [Acidobacteria bacterium]|nr:MAG: hypothetical protein DMF56_11690 [Acidobacteriota bacterium]
MSRGSLSAFAFLILACGAGPDTAVKAAAHNSGAATPIKASSSLGPTTFIVFADVTRSLTDEEQHSVIENVQKVVDILPPRGRLLVFPILEDVERANALMDRQLPELQTTSDAVAADMQRASMRKQVAASLESVLRGPAHGRDRTCVSGALRKADELAMDLRDTVEIVLVSDMLEDCDDSLLRTPLRLQKSSISQELKRARDLASGALLDLNGASVTAVLPTVPTSKQKVARPPVHELKAFWRAILDHCGDQPANYRFGTGFPKRLLDYKQRQEGGI